MRMATEPHQTTAWGARCARWHLLVAMVVGAVVLLGLMPFVFDHWFYPAHYLSDLPNDYRYAHATVVGHAPYRSFFPEYPPLSLWLIVPPALSLSGHVVDFPHYQVRFAAEMFVLAAACAALVALTARRLWHDALRAYFAVGVFAVFILAIGPLMEDRFDMGVALVSALVLLALVYGRPAVAAVLVGLGCAYKITPIVLFPLPVCLVGWSRRLVVICALCLAATIVGFLPYLVTATAGIRHVLTYQTQRPLELESLLGLPVIAGHLLTGAPLYIGVSHRSWSLAGPYSTAMTSLATPLTILALGVVVALLWRGRTTLRNQPRTLALGVLALYLAFLCGDLVLSPQYLIWLIPAAVLVALDDPPLGLAVLVTTTLTQLEFPTLWTGIIVLRPVDLLCLCARNLCLAATFGLALRRLWRLPGRAANPDSSRRT